MQCNQNDHNLVFLMPEWEKKLDDHHHRHHESDLAFMVVNTGASVWFVLGDTLIIFLFWVIRISVISHHSSSNPRYFIFKRKAGEGEGEDRDRRERERERESPLRLEPAVCFWCVCVRASFRRTRAPVRSVPVGWPGGRCVGLRLRLRLRLALPCVISSIQHYVFHPDATVCYVA